jgi:iron(III) transport system substrate-binding protein
VIAGECDLALVNHYYLARMIAGDPSVADRVAVHWPEAGGGVHVNISGAGVAAGAPNPEAARMYLEFLASDLAQRLVAEGNSEYPSVPGVAYDNPVITGFGEFEADPMNVALLGDNQAEAQRIFDRAGWP